MRRFSFFLIGMLAFIAATLITAEGLLRMREYFFDDPRAVAARDEVRTIVARIHRLWFRNEEAEHDPFIPPFQVFSNIGFGDAERLAFIANESVLPPSQEWTSYDFLQDESKAESTTYTVRSNALGFRGAEHPAEKPEGTRRVIVLGSYQAFGLGVEDDEAYPAALESTLNADGEGKYEIWNGGRPAGTAIVGLARFDEALSYEPDLLVLDYGFVDTLVYGDNVFPLAMRFPDSWVTRVARAIAQPALYVFDHSRLSDRLFWFFVQGKGQAERVANFSATMEEMIKKAREAEVPVVLVRQLETLPSHVYESLEASDVALVDVERILAHATSTPPSPEEWTSGYYADTWLSELDPEVVAYAPQQFRFYQFRLNIYQLNSRGQALVADALAPVVRGMLEK